MSHDWDVFIAHATPDKVVARELYLRLKDRCRAFLDEASIGLGDNWPATIRSAQESSRFTVVLVSSSTDAAYYEQEEIAAAVALARKDGESHRVVPVYLDSEAAGTVPYGLRLKHGITLDSSTSLSDVASRLLAELQRLKASGGTDDGRPVRLRVVYADDSAFMRRSVAALIETEDEVDLVGDAHDMPSLLALVDETLPDVVITDLRMPPSGTDEGLLVAERLRHTHPDIGVVVLSAHADPDCARALMAGGSERRGYLLKDHLSDPDSLLVAVRAVATGQAHVDPDIIKFFLTARGSRGALDRLTGRERDVLAEMASGLSNLAVATKLSISERAVEKHVNAIFSKLDLFNSPDSNRRVQAVLLLLAESAK